MASSSGNLSPLLDPGYRMVFFNWLEEHAEQFSQVFNVLSSERAYEEDIVFAGLGPLQEKPEGANVLYDDPIQGAAVRYTHRVWALGFRVTREMYDDDLYGLVKRVVTALARSAHHTIETVAFDVLNNGFTTQLVEDGLSLFHTAHTMKDGSTQSNRSATSADLTVDSLQQAIDSFERHEDHRSLPMALRARTLQIPPELKWKARELLNSTERPDTSDRAINALYEEGMTYKVSHYLDSTSNWFLLANQDEHDLKFYRRDGVEFSSTDDFDSGDMKSKARTRCSAGATVWQGTWGSLGGGA